MRFCEGRRESVLPTVMVVLAPCVPYRRTKLAQPPSLGSRFVPDPGCTSAAGSAQEPRGLCPASLSLGCSLPSSACSE